jgi:DNA (cytosine-5)-methyltransferase 1
MKHGNLFSGIGGFDLAAEWMGWENVFHCEWNEFGKKVLKYYWPKAISYHDITKTDFTIHRGAIDILTGGFPCQPYSAAGKRLGTADDRHLWPQMLRAIREIQPRWIVGENVFGLVNWSGGLVFHEVQADLEAEGYEVFPYVLPACAVNAPHRRDRIWFVAYSDSIRHSPCGKGKEFERGGCENNGKQKERSEQTKRINGFHGLLQPTPNTEHERFQKPQPSEQPQQLFNVKRNDTQITPDTDSNERFNLHRPKTTNRGEQQALPWASNFGSDGNATNSKHKGLERHNERSGCTINRENKGVQSGAENKQPTTNTDSRRQPSEKHRQTQSGRFTKKGFSNYWTNFPTQSPICSRNDELSGRLDGITFPKWRNESIKAYGNAVVPQLVYQIFKAIQMYESNP